MKYVLFEDYMVFDNGDIVSKYGNPITAHINSQTGYIQIDLIINKERKTFNLHRLLAELFIPNIDNKAHVAHKDGNKLNTYVANLEWNTASENELTKVTMTKGLLYASKDGVEYGPFNGVKEAINMLCIPGTYNAISSSISKCIKGESRTCRTYSWCRKYRNA